MSPLAEFPSLVPYLLSYCRQNISALSATNTQIDIPMETTAVSRERSEKDYEGKKERELFISQEFYTTGPARS